MNNPPTLDEMIRQIELEEDYQRYMGDDDTEDFLMMTK